MGHNSLTELPADLLQDLVWLSDFQVSFNRLTTLPESFFQGSPSLRIVYLVANDIEQVPESVFSSSSFSSTADVRFGGNELSDETKAMLTQQLGGRAFFQ